MLQFLLGSCGLKKYWGCTRVMILLCLLPCEWWASPCLERITEVSPYWVHCSEGRFHLRLKSFWVSDWLVAWSVTIFFSHINCWILEATSRVIMSGTQGPKAQARTQSWMLGCYYPCGSQRGALLGLLIDVSLEWYAFIIPFNFIKICLTFKWITYPQIIYVAKHYTSSCLDCQDT